MKCLEKDRNRRYETANGLAADLNRHLNDEPVAARPPSAAYRLQKTIRSLQHAIIAALLNRPNDCSTSSDASGRLTIAIP
jgi:ABC-type lipopolysaccharide export system ATPase subunit